MHYREGEILVKFRDKISESEADKKVISKQASIKWKSHFTKVIKIKLPKDISVEKALEIYKNDPDVEYAEPNYIVKKAEVVPNDPFLIQQWFHKNTGQYIGGDFTRKTGTSDADIDTTDAWDITKGSNDIIIAIIDTGVDYNHPDLKDNIYRNPGEICNDGIDNDGDGFVDDCIGWNFSPYYSKRRADNDPYDDDCDGHGTHVAGIIGAIGNNGMGVSGINWNVKILPIKALTGVDKSCDDSGTTDIANLLSAMEYAILMGAKVVNASYTYPLSCSKTVPSLSEKEMIIKLKEAGILFIAAAGNYGCNNDIYPFYPASHKVENIISVAATDSDDNHAIFNSQFSSNYGINSVHISAPGKDIYSTIPESLGSYGFMTGTSMAAPVVAGVAGLLLAKNPNYSYKELKDIILNSGDVVSSLINKTITGRRINVFRALSSAYISTLPAKPAISDVILNNGKITIKWEDNSDNEAGFSIERAVNSNNFIEFANVNANAVVYEDDIVINEGTQCYRLRAYNNSGKSGYSNYKCFILTPLKPTDFYGIRKSETEIQLFWTDNSKIETGYEIERSLDGVNFNKIATTNKNSYYFVDQVNDNSDYYYKIKAISNVGNSEYPDMILIPSFTVNKIESNGSSKRCFIATAAYGTPFHPHIDVLRDFRDRVLMKFSVGRMFISAYYKYSPEIANVIKESFVLRVVCLMFIVPVVYFIKFPVFFIIAFFFLLYLYIFRKQRVISQS